jgi:hypothetical protein
MLKIVVALLLVSLVPAAHADILEFDMPGLTGNSTDALVTSSFVYNGPSAAVTSISIRVMGVVTDLGEICCGGPAYCPGPTYDWFMKWYGFVANTDDPSPGRWSASYPGYLDQIAAFDETGPGENQDGFTSLSDGDVINVSLYFGRANWLGECDLIQTPTGTMNSVTVIMDVTYPLPVNASTWGAIKALYR